MASLSLGGVSSSLTERTGSHSVKVVAQMVSREASGVLNRYEGDWWHDRAIVFVCMDNCLDGRERRYPY